MHSYTPAIEAIVAVGAMARSSELRMPLFAMRARRASQRSGQFDSTS